MSISVQCPNGHKISAKEKLAGKRVKCPKCGSVIQIPELESIEQDEGLVLDIDASQPEPETDWLAGGKTNDVTDDLLGLGLGFSDVDPLASGAATGASTGSPYAPVPRPVSSPPTKQAPAAKLSMPLILAIAGGGSLVGLLCVGLVGWLLFGGADTATEVATNNIAAPAAGPVVEIAASPTPEQVASPSETQSTPATPEPAPLAREPLPFELVQLKLDPRLDGFKLPGTTWASAYDEVTGRLAITNDEKGILIYDLDELLKGSPAPVATIPTRGLPTAVCLKPLPDRRAFVIAGQDAAELLLVDTETLQPFGKVVLSELKYVDFLTGTRDPSDPFVYYSSQAYRASDPTPSEREANDTAERIGRVDLVTGKQSGHTKQRFVDVTISPDGQRFYARPDTTEGGVATTWEGLLNYSASVDHFRSGFTTWNRVYTVSPPCCLGESVAINSLVYNNSLNARLALLDFSPAATFTDRPLLIGLGSRDIVFGSANDYRRLASIPLPANWLRGERAVDPIDFRLRPGLSPIVQSGFCEITTDSERELGLLVFGEHLVVASLSETEVPDEPSLFVHTSFPATVNPGQEVRLELEADAKDAVFEFVPHADWLPDESARVLGDPTPGEPSPRPLELAMGVGAEHTYISLKDFKPLIDKQPPFRLRIGNEIMLVTKKEFPKLHVERTHPIAHGFNWRIAVLDELGRDITTPAATAPPSGKRLILAAAINNQQEIIFVRDAASLNGEELPFNVQIGDEKMVVTKVDDFKEALIVQRSEPVNHSVTSDAFVLDESAASVDLTANLPTIDGRTFRWTPSAAQIGRQTIRMRASLGTVVHEWLWETAVEQDIVDLPFQVVGIEPQRGTNRAVIWGRSNGLGANPSTEPAVYFIGVYDLAEKKLVHHAEVPKPIMTAALHETGVYATLVAFDMEPKADPQAESNRRRAMTQVTPTQIVRFDVESLSITEQVAISGHSNRLTVIADKYLAAYIRGETLRFNIPALTAVEPPVLGYEYPIAGRVGNGWVWDGVLWDESMTKPQLLMFPVHFERPPGAHSPPEMKCAAGGVTQMLTEGPYASTWFPINVGPVGQHRLNGFPGGLSYKDGVVSGHSWAAPSRLRVGTAPTPTSVPLIDPQTLTVKRGNTYGLTESTAYLTEADGQVHAALLGKLYSVALDQLIEQEEAFRFVEQQDQFVLEVGKPAKLRYSAPGAAKYQLQLWYQRPSFHDDQPNITSESTDGTFELALDEIENYAGAALSFAGVRATDRTAKDKLDHVAEYLKRITPAYQSLTGSKPKGVPVPVYISVTAEHEDGQQKAGLAHSYLIEVPFKQVREMAER